MAALAYAHDPAVLTWLSPKARILLGLVAGHPMTADGLTCHPTMEMLQLQTGWSKTTVKKYRSELVECGVVRVLFAPGRGRANTWTVLVPDELSTGNGKGSRPLGKTVAPERPLPAQKGRPRATPSDEKGRKTVAPERPLEKENY